MLRLVCWTATTAVLLLLVWQTAAVEPLWPRALSAVLLMLLSILAGLRIGADSAAAYAKDLQRLNKVLVEQNRDLGDVNAMLLKQIESEANTPSETR